MCDDTWNTHLFSYSQVRFHRDLTTPNFVTSFTYIYETTQNGATTTQQQKVDTHTQKKEERYTPIYITPI